METKVRTTNHFGQEEVESLGVYIYDMITPPKGLMGNGTLEDALNRIEYLESALTDLIVYIVEHSRSPSSALQIITRTVSVSTKVEFE